jgi:phosphatidate cytidylyltransferase
MLVKRTLVALILLPFGLAAIFLGGWVYTGVVGLILGLAAWEYVLLFRSGGLQPAGLLVVGGTISLVVGRALDGFASAPWLLSLVILIGMAYHLVAYERGRDAAGSDFGVTLAGVLYLGWIGAYLVSLRQLADGQWWLMVILPAVWLADSAAYFAGTRFGRHKLSPRLSPKKTWEGYLAGIPASIAGTALLAALWRVWAGPASAITPIHAAWIALAVSVITTLGDLGESMIKRQVGVKDSGHLLPGHGGAFDRIDSWLWGGVIGYYLVVWLFLKP